MSFGPPTVATPATLISCAVARSLPNCPINTPGTSPAVSGIVTPNPTIAFLPKVLIGFDCKFGVIPSSSSDDSALKNLPTEELVLNTAFLIVNFISSY